MKFVKVLLSLISLIIMLVLSIFNCDRKNSTLVARVAGRQITLQEFEIEFAKGKHAEAILKPTLEEKKDFLNGMIDKQLKIIDAYQQHLDKDKQILDQVNQRKLGFIFNRLIEREVVQKVIPESKIRAYYNRMNKEVKIRQIFVKFDPKVAGQKEQALEKAKDLTQKLKKREDFALLAEVYSDDINTAKKGGDKGFLKWGPTSDENPLYLAAFAMKKDQMSSPIETPNGYYIIKVDQIKEYPALPYEQQRERISQQVYRARNNELADAYYKYLDVLKNKYKLKYDEAALDVFVKQLPSIKESPSDSLAGQSEKQRNEITPLDNFTEAEKTLSIVTFQGGKITINDVINEIKNYPTPRRPQFKSKAEAQDFINTVLVPRYLFQEEAELKRIENDIKVKDQINGFKENIMLNNIQKIEISDKLNISDDDLKKYFEEHREDYKNPETREIQQIFVKDKNSAEQIVRRARKGENFTKLFRRYNEKDAIKKNDGIIEITGGRAGISKPAFSVNLGEVADPEKIGEGYYIVKVLNIKQATLQTYDEAKNTVASKCRRSAYENREKQWIEELRKRINYIIYEQNLKKSFGNYESNHDLTVK